MISTSIYTISYSLYEKGSTTAIKTGSVDTNVPDVQQPTVSDGTFTIKATVLKEGGAADNDYASSFFFTGLRSIMRLIAPGPRQRV